MTAPQRHLPRAHGAGPLARLRALSLLPLLFMLGACTQLAPPGAPGAPGAGAVPGQAPGAPPVAVSAVYTVDPLASLVAVTVRRAGPMARLGHDHVVASHTLAGYVTPGANSAEVSFRLDEMTVDEPALLRAAGIEKTPSAPAIEGTRTNMLGPVLDAQRYPLVTLRAQQQGDGQLGVAITLHGVTRMLALPASVQIDAVQVTASGSARFKQSDFGITPFSVGGGLLSVQDELEVRYQIVARR